MSVFAGLPKIPARAAMTLAQRGLPVFLCGQNKRPLTTNGFKDATVDLEQIKQWWRKHPSALIGLPTGERSGLDVLDFDRKHGDPDDMIDSLQMTVDAMLRGPRVGTQSGGYHQYFQHDARVTLGAGRFMPGVDWRGEGGYVIAPGSPGYELIADGEIEPWPEALLQLVLAHQGSARPQLEVVGGLDAKLTYKPTLEQHATAAVTEGSRHDGMLRMIAILIGRGFSYDEVMQFAPLFMAAGARDLAEIRQAARGAFEKWGINPAGAPRPDASTIELVPLSGLASRDPPSWQIAGVIPEKAFGYIYGASNTFKTFLALDMGLSIAYGRAWQGRPVKSGVVAYILGEGQGAFANRVRVWRTARRLLETDAPFYTIFRPIRMTDPQDLGALVQAIEGAGVKPDWVFVDTVQRNFGAGDPDKTQDMTTFVGMIDALRGKFDCGVFGVHHAGKDLTRGARNSSVLYASADFEIKVEREEGDPRLKVTNTKPKEWEPFPPMWLTTEKVVTDDPRTGEEVSSLVIRDGAELAPRAGAPEGAVQCFIMEILRRGGSLTFGEIVARSGKNRGTVWNALTALEKKYALVKDADSGCYYIPEENQ